MARPLLSREEMTFQVEWTEARNGQPTVRVTMPGERQVFLHSAYDPRKEAAAWCEKLNIGDNAILVVFGLGVGHHLRELLKRVEPERKIVVVEPHDEIRGAFSSEALSREFPSHKKVFIVGDWTEFKQLYLRIGGSWENLCFASLPASARVFEDQFKDFTAKFKEEMRCLSANWATTLTRTDLWQANFLKNLRFLPEIHCVSNAFGRFKGRPAIIVSTGPSLNKNIQLLHEAKNKALIMAVGSSARLLLKEGIVPDLVATFDGHSNNFENVFKDLPLPPRVPLVFDPVCHHRIAEEHPGPKVMMLVHPNNLWLDGYFDGGVGGLKVGGSIANTTFDMALRFGADPIIFVGQDLAYTDDKLYAEGSTNWKNFVIGEKAEALKKLSEKEKEEAQYQLDTANRIEYVEGIDGQPVPTSAMLKIFLHWFEEEFANAGPERTIINATEGGANIRGAVNRTLADTLERYCAADLTVEIEAFRADLLSPSGFQGDDFRDYLKQCRKEIRQQLPLLKRGVEVSRKLVRHFSDGVACDTERLLARLDKVDRGLKEGRGSFALIHYMLAPMELIARYPGETDNAEVDVCSQSLQLYNGMRQVFKAVTPLLDELDKALAKPRKALRPTPLPSASTNVDAALGP